MEKQKNEKVIIKRIKPMYYYYKNNIFSLKGKEKLYTYVSIGEQNVGHEDSSIVNDDYC